MDDLEKHLSENDRSHFMLPPTPPRISTLKDTIYKKTGRKLWQKNKIRKTFRIKMAEIYYKFGYKCNWTKLNGHF